MDLKELARGFSGFVNKEYRDSKAVVLDEETSLKLSCNNYLNLPEHLEEALGVPGLPFGQIVQVYGKKDSGKSTLLQQAMACAQSQDILPILILTEPKFDVDRFEIHMEGDREAMIIIQPDSLEDGMSRVEKILNSLKDGFIILEDDSGNETKVDIGDKKIYFFWDSIGGTSSLSELGYDIEDHDKDMGRFAQALKKMVKRIWRKLHFVKDQAGVLFLNQVWDSRTPMGITVEKPYGGESVQHYYALEIQLKKKQEILAQIQGVKRSLGYNVEIRVKKNHLTADKPRTPLCVTAKGFIPPSDLSNYKKSYAKLYKERKKRDEKAKAKSKGTGSASKDEKGK